MTDLHTLTRYIHCTYEVALEGPVNPLGRSSISKVNNAQTFATIFLDPDATGQQNRGYLHDQSWHLLTALILSLSINAAMSLDDLSSLLNRDLEHVDAFCRDWLRGRKPTDDPTSNELGDEAQAFIRKAFCDFVDVPTGERSCVYTVARSALRSHLYQLETASSR